MERSPMVKGLVQDGEAIVASERLAQACVDALEPEGYVVRYGWAAEPEGAWKVWIACRPDEPWMRTLPDGTPERPWSGDWTEHPQRAEPSPEGEGG